MDEATNISEEVDEEYGPENRGGELPEKHQNKENRLKRLRKAKTKLDKKEQWQKGEQAEKILKREEETESGETICGRKHTPPEDVDFDDDTNANTTNPESQTMGESRQPETGLQRSGDSGL